MYLNVFFWFFAELVCECVKSLIQILETSKRMGRRHVPTTSIIQVRDSSPVVVRAFRREFGNSKKKRVFYVEKVSDLDARGQCTISYGVDLQNYNIHALHQGYHRISFHHRDTARQSGVYG